VVYANAYGIAREQASYVVACIVFLRMKLNIVLYNKLACKHFQIFFFWGGGDDGILWLSFAQQKFVAKLCTWNCVTDPRKKIRCHL
jgi:hypothetical protein